MQYFWNNFMAAPHVMHPKVVLLPQKSVFGKNGESIARTVVHKIRGRNRTGADTEGGVVSVDVEVFVFPNSSAGAKGNATDARLNGALSRMFAMESQMNGLMSRLFPGVGPVLELPRNRSAYSVVEVFPAQHVAVDRVAVPTSSPAADYDTVIASSGTYASSACTKITLLMLLMTGGLLHLLRPRQHAALRAQEEPRHANALGLGHQDWQATAPARSTAGRIQRPTCDPHHWSLEGLEGNPED
ncbi:hypothetical protein MTO96_002329 [Rhipicephalus appendiculatus]